jgi:rubredoxin/uncharacterized membrane protein
MKKWECTVCGYIHEGEEPPAECPICGAGPEYFKELVERAEPAGEETAPEPEKVEQAAAAAPSIAPSSGRRWECTVCGYIHEGDAPPAECPICGAGPEYFKEIVEKDSGSLTEAALQSPDAGAAAGKAAPGLVTRLVLKFHLHPITVHSPQGILPMAVLFLFLAIAFGLSGFETAAFFSLVFTLLTMPVVIVTGYLEWQNRYQGIKSKIFIAKISASIVVTTTLLVLVIWRLIEPGVSVSDNRWIYLGVGVVMVLAAGIAGHIGGKLIFDTRDR